MSLQRSHRLNIRLSQAEWEKVHRLCANSTCRSVSEYARKILLKEPVSQLFRNPSLAELATHVPPLVDYITNGAIAMGPTNPEFLNTYGNVLESAEDIRTLLTRLIELCDQK